MLRIGGIIFPLCYIIGLLSTGISSGPVHEFSTYHWTGFFLSVIIVTTVTTIFVPRFWRTGPPRIYWLTGGIIILLAVVYFHLRLPSQGINDISHQLDNFQTNFSPTVEITGKIISEPRLTRKNKARFIFKAETFQYSSQTTNVNGKLYVTAPLLRVTGLYPSCDVTLIGNLYKPFTAVNPGGFDFQAYLSKQGIFAGFTVDDIKLNQEGNTINWALWQLRTRIVRTQVRWLKVPAGNFISSIVLGRRSVDFSYELQDLFVKTGLVHILAVSGFHVTLWLGTILFLFKNFSIKIKLISGLFTLIIIPIITGFYPSILRATFMGLAVLIAMITKRQINSLGSLLLAANILLLINPLWIWDLGFQLSFLATLGLIVTAPAIIARLDFMPPTLANLIAIPTAAYLWTFPLQIYIFYSICTYSILANIITSPLVIIVSLGGMISAFFGVIFPLIGSAIAYLLLYPTLALIKTVEFWANLPANYFSVGQISLTTLIIIYTLYIAIWLIPWCTKNWRSLSLFLLIVIIIPIIYQKMQLIQVTVLASQKQPIILIQDQGKNTLINIGNQENIQYTVKPFLAQQGINKLEQIILLNSKQENFKALDFLLNNLSVNKIYLSNNQTQNIQKNYQVLNLDKNLVFNNTKIQLISQNPAVLQLNLFSKNWLILEGKDLAQNSWKLNNIKANVLLFSEFNLEQNILDQIKPKVAIALENFVTPLLEKQLEKEQIELYITKEDSAIQWNPQKGFSIYAPEYDIMG